MIRGKLDWKRGSNPPPFQLLVQNLAYFAHMCPFGSQTFTDVRLCSECSKTSRTDNRQKKSLKYIHNCQVSNLFEKVEESYANWREKTFSWMQAKWYRLNSLYHCHDTQYINDIRHWCGSFFFHRILIENEKRINCGLSEPKQIWRASLLN